MATEPAGEGPDIKARVPLANVKPRLRMATLYDAANSLNYLVAGTGNRSELTIGMSPGTATAASTCCPSATC